MSSFDFQPGGRDAHSGGPVRQRPVGVIVAAIVLGLLGCMGLFASFSVLAAALFLHSPQTAQYPPGFVGVQIAMGLGMLVVSALCVLVVIGLFQMKNWSRVGVVILGGFLAVFYGLGAIGCVAFALSSLVNTPNPGAPNLTPQMMRAAFLVMAALSLLLAAVGAWWLVYFNRRRVRDLFSTGGVAAVREYSAGDEVTAPQVTAAPVARRSVVEILVICLAVFYLLSAVSGIVVALLHFPVLFVGVIFRGGAASAVYAVLSAVNLVVGVGLLRKMNLARVAAIFLQGVWMVSSVLPFVPGRSGVMEAYQKEMMQRMSTWLPAVPDAQNQFLQAPGASVISVLPALIVGGAIIWLLVRARPFFEK